MNLSISIPHILDWALAASVCLLPDDSDPFFDAMISLIDIPLLSPPREYSKKSSSSSSSFDIGMLWRIGFDPDDADAGDFFLLGVDGGVPPVCGFLSIVISAKESRGVVSSEGGSAGFFAIVKSAKLRRGGDESTGAGDGAVGFFAIVKSARLRRGTGAGEGDGTGFGLSVGLLLFFIVKSARLRLGMTAGGLDFVSVCFGFDCTFGLLGRNGSGEFNDANLSFCSFINASNAAFFFSCCSTNAFDETSTSVF